VRVDDGADVAIAQYNADLDRLLADSLGEDVLKVERLVREWARAHAPWLEEIDVACRARALSDVHWARKHPVSAFALAWKHRQVRPLHRSLLWLWRPRFVG
jgi:hypothetical protein